MRGSGHNTSKGSTCARQHCTKNQILQETKPKKMVTDVCDVVEEMRK